MPMHNLELNVSWEEYHRAIELLALEIHASGWQFDQILCLARGGLRIGDVFSRLFNCPLAILSVSSYREEGGTKQSTLNISPTITATFPYLKGNVLIVDDLVDSGISLREVIKLLPSMFPQLVEIKSAVIWYKQNSVFAPDFYLEYLEHNPWIIQPFEKYDHFSIADLQSKEDANAIKTAINENEFQFIEANSHE
jgi:hypoxanthine phosphoribosyltransferase